MTAIPLFADDEFQYGLELALGSTYRQAADTGEVLCTADRIPDGDANSWIEEWTRTAATAAVPAQDARLAGTTPRTLI